MSDTAAEAVRKILESQQQVVVFVHSVTKFHDSGKGSAPRVLAATPYQISFWKKNKIIRKLDWIDLTKIEFVEPDRLNLTFRPIGEIKTNRLCNFGLPSIKTDIIPFILNITQRLLPEKLSKDSGINALAKQFGCVKEPCPASCLTRMYAYSVSRGKTISDEMVQKLTTILQQRQKNVVVPFSNDKDEQPYIVAALQTDKYLENLIFSDEQPTDQFTSMATLPGKICPSLHITFSQKIQPQSSLFTYTSYIYSNKSSSSVTGITFRNAEIEEDEVLNKLIKHMDAVEFNSLAFVNGFNPRLNDSFLNNFNQYNLGDKLKVLKISAQEGLEVSKLLPSLKSVVALSLSDNDLELGDTLQAICQAGLPALRALDLSGNRVTKEIVPLGIRVPETLERLDISYSTFCEGGLKSLFQFLFRNRFVHGLRLRATGIKASDEDIGAACGFLASLKHSPVTSIDFSNNFVTSTFFGFLKASKHLHTIVLDGVFDENDKELLSKLNDVIPLIKDLRMLSVRASKTKKLGASLGSLLESAAKAEKLEEIYVGGHSSGDEVSKLSKVITKTSLKFAEFDENEASLEGINSILDAAKNRGEDKPIVLSLPHIDLSKVDADKAREVAMLCNVLSKTDVKYDEKDSYTNFFDCFVAQTEYRDNFPEYMSPAFVAELEAAADINEEGEDDELLKSPRAAKKEKSQSYSYEEVDDVERQMRQNERRNFYLDIDTTDDMETSAAGDRSEKTDDRAEPRRITEDGFVEPAWDAFDADVLQTFDNTAALQKLEKKYALPILRENIQ